MAVTSLGLDQLAPFDPDKKIVEYHFRPPAPLMSMTASRFVDEVSTESPAPGGGSVAALMGSLAAALATMVANLTVGKKGYESVWAEQATLAEEGQRVKDRLVRAVGEDTDAFNRVMDAMRLPKDTSDESAARTKALESASKHAAEVPLQTARLCLDALRLAEQAALNGNTNSASDAGVAGLAAQAGLEGAALNVLINLGSIADKAFASRCSTEIERVVADGRRIRDAILARVTSTFAVKAAM